MKTASSAAAKPAAGNIAILASAGAGKTYRLALRFIELLAAGVPPERILATTFTRKAAGEILGRVLSWIALAALDRQQGVELAEKVGVPSAFDWLALLSRLTGNLHRLAIGTLDSYFARLAGCYGLELGLPAGWQLLEEADEAALRLEAIGAAIARHPMEVTALVRNMAKGEVRRSVTNELNAMAAHLRSIYLDSPAEAWRCVPHLAERSAADIENALQRLAAAPVPQKRAEDFRDARARDVALARAGQWIDFAKSTLALAVLNGRPTYYREPLPEIWVDCYGILVDHARAVNVNRIAAQTEATRDLLERVESEYRALQRERKAIGYDDVTAALGQPTFAALRAEAAHRLDSAIEAVLLDEFQDTARPQWQIVAPLAATAARTPGGFFCVGDRKQAIYSWRGGMAELFDVLDASVPNLVFEPLAVSQRSAPAVIAAVNRVFGSVAANASFRAVVDDDPEVFGATTQWLKDFRNHSTARNEFAGRVEFRTGSAAGPDEDQRVCLFADAAQRVVELRREHPTRTIAVLTRKNDAIATIMAFLAKHGVAASEEGGVHIDDDPAVSAFLSLLTLADHPGDEIAAEHVRMTTLWRAVDDASKPATLETIARRIRVELLERGYGPTLKRWADHPFVAASLNGRSRVRIQQLVGLAHAYEPQATLRPGDFVAHVQSKKLEDPSAAQVRVMNVHKSKGLEFDIVILPELESNLIGTTPSVVTRRAGKGGPIDAVSRYVGKELAPLFPAELRALYSGYRDGALVESLNTLYVAMTRARHELHVLIAPVKDPKKPPATHAGLLRHAVGADGPLAPQSVFFAIANEGAAGAESQSEPAPIQARTAGGALQLAPPAKTRRRGLAQQSPSQLEGGDRVDLKFVMALDNAQVLNRGTIFHRLFCQIDWFENGSPNDDALILAIAPELVPPTAASDYVVEFRRMLANKAIGAALSRSRYGKADVELWRERRFAVRLGNSLMAGAFDRVVVVHEAGRAVRAEILDFKTDAPAGAGSDAAQAKFVRERVALYRPQMLAYRGALARMTALPEADIRMTLLFVSLGLRKEL